MTSVVQFEDPAVRASRLQRFEDIMSGGFASPASELTFSNLQLGDEVGPRLVARLEPIETLRELDLGWDRLREGTTRALAHSTLAGRLVRLDLSGNHLGAAGLAALFERPWPDLEELLLSWCALDDVAIRALVETTSLPNLRRLSLRRNHLTDPSAHALADSWLPHQLESLDMEYNELSGGDAWDVLSGAFGMALI